MRNTPKSVAAAVVMQLSLRYVKASIVYLLVGASLMALAFAGGLPFAVTAFYFMQLYGFVAMMIFGLSYLFIPAISHALLHSIRIARAQFWLMNLGVIALTISFSGILPPNPNLQIFVLVSLIVQLLALYLHAYNILRTVQGWKGSPGDQLVKLQH